MIMIIQLFRVMLHVHVHSAQNSDQYGIRNVYKSIPHASRQALFIAAGAACGGADRSPYALAACYSSLC